MPDSPRDDAHLERTHVEPEVEVVRTDEVEVVREDVVDERTAVVPPVPPAGEVAGAEVRAVSEDEVVEFGPDGAVHRRVDRVEQTASTRNPLVPALLAILLLALAAIAAAWYLTRKDETSVPQVVGLTLDQAVQRLQEDGLKSDITNRATDTAPEGTIVEQSPQAGETVEDGTTVAIVASQGPEQQAVPEVVGLALPAARAELEAAGITATVTRIASERPRGVVIAQNPTGGTQVEQGAAVTLQVSRGAPAVTVPNAVGLDEVSARDRLVAEGLRPSVVEVFSEDPEGQVVAQAPEAGGEVADGSRVVLRVSKGSATVTVPSAVGTDVEAAQLAVTDAGLVPNVVRVPSAEPEGTVVAQNPTGGEARRGSTVRLNVSTGVPR